MPSDVHGVRVLDPAVIDGLRETLGPEEAHVLDTAVSLFFGRSTMRLREARDAAARGDSQVLASLAHQLRGGASQLGAERMAHVASQIEEVARNGAVDRATVLVGDLMEAFIDTRAALRQLGLGPAQQPELDR
jgi:HPt (histidine-containing phosphotransfer) domain-containing protein